MRGGSGRSTDRQAFDFEHHLPRAARESRGLHVCFRLHTPDKLEYFTTRAGLDGRRREIALRFSQLHPSKYWRKPPHVRLEVEAVEGRPPMDTNTKQSQK